MKIKINKLFEINANDKFYKIGDIVEVEKPEYFPDYFVTRIKNTLGMNSIDFIPKKCAEIIKI